MKYRKTKIAKKTYLSKQAVLGICVINQLNCLLIFNKLRDYNFVISTIRFNVVIQSDNYLKCKFGIY